jgi:multiple sugar transport system ATP-binding protein
MAQVKISNAVKRYGAHQVLGGVSLDIEDGEFTVLVGPSGCGKSTLLRMIAGLEDISEGSVSIGAKIVNALPPKERDIAMVFQNYALYPHMTVEQNMAFSLRISGMAKAEQQRRVGDAANILGLSSLLQRLPRQLSGGQRQRVAMGRAIVRKPKVFLFDEPLSNLDAKLRVVMRAEIKSLHQRIKTTTVYVTHDQVEAMTMADKIVVMNKGRIEQVGTPLDLYNSPSNLFVAGFIGSPAMNFIEGTLTKADATSITLDDVLTLPMGPKHLRMTGQKVIYGIRPEHLLIDRERGIPAEIQLVEPMGSETQLMVSVGGRALTMLVREQIAVRVGDTIPVYPIPDQAMLFDGVSNRRLHLNA